MLEAGHLNSIWRTQPKGKMPMHIDTSIAHVDTSATKTTRLTTIRIAVFISKTLQVTPGHFSILRLLTGAYCRQDACGRVVFQFVEKRYLLGKYYHCSFNLIVKSSDNLTILVTLMMPLISAC